MKRQTLLATALVFFCLFAALYSTHARSTTETALVSTSQETASQPSDLSEKIRLLSSANPIERATAACQIGMMGKRAAQAIPYLIQMLGDDSQIIGGIYCEGEQGRGRHIRGGNEPTTPGKVAAEALAGIGAQSVDALVSVVRHSSPIVSDNGVL